MMSAKILIFNDPTVNDVKAVEAHEEEANRLGAEFYNFGWSSGGEIEHFWHDVE